MALPWTIDYEVADLASAGYDNLQNSASMATVSTDAVKTGSKGMKVLYTGSAVIAYGQMLSEAIANGYFATHIFIDPDLVSGTAYAQHAVLQLADASTNLISVGFQVGSGGAPYRWFFSSSVLSGTTYTADPRNAWHWLKIQWIQDGSAGGARVWIDGTERFTDVDQDTTGYEIDTVRHGSINGGNPANGDYLYFDNFMASATDIDEPSDAEESAIPSIIPYYNKLLAG